MGRKETEITTLTVKQHFSKEAKGLIMLGEATFSVLPPSFSSLAGDVQQDFKENLGLLAQ